MKKTLVSLAVLAGLLLSPLRGSAFPSATNTASFSTPTYTSYRDFRWTWSGSHDRTIDVEFRNSGYDVVIFQMSRPRGGRPYLTIYTEGIQVNTNGYTDLLVDIPRTNIPPQNSYYAEFIAADAQIVTNGIVTNTVYTRTALLASGMINTEWSVFEFTPNAAYNPTILTVYVTGGVSLAYTETDPIYAEEKTNLILKTDSAGLDASRWSHSPATQAVAMATNDLNLVASVRFVADSISRTNEGNVYWDSADSTLALVTDQRNPDGSPVTQQVGFESLARVSNLSGVTISNGQVVALRPVTGNRIAVTLAQAGTSNGHAFAVATHNITNNGDGIVTWAGIVNQLNLASFNEGDIVYLSTNRGGITTNYLGEGQISPFEIGHIEVSHASVGKLFVHLERDEDDPWFYSWLSTNTLLSSLTNTYLTTNLAAITYLSTATAASTYATITAMQTTNEAQDAAIALRITGAAATSSFYLASNPSNYQTGAQVATNIDARIATNGFIKGSTVSNQFLALSGIGAMQGSLDMGTFSVTNIAILAGEGGRLLRMPDGEIEGIWTFLDQPTIPGYVTTNGNANGLTNFPSTLATEAKLVASSNTLFAQSLAIGLGATNFALIIAANDTNKHLAQGLQITNNTAAIASLSNGVNTVGEVATNAQTLATAALPLLSATGLVDRVLATNRFLGSVGGQTITNSTGLIVYGTNTPNDYAYSGFLPYLVGQPIFGAVFGGSATKFAIIGAATNEATALARYNGGQWYKIYDAFNFSPSSYLLYSEWTASLPIAGAVTQNQIGVSGQVYYNATNIMFALGGTNWFRVAGGLNQ